VTSPSRPLSARALMARLPEEISSFSKVIVFFSLSPTDRP
jgi:hypothetical protein